MAQEDFEGSGRSHQGSYFALLRQYEQYSYWLGTRFHVRTKHIEVHYHFIREHVLAGDVDLQHISTNFQTTDIFTKALRADKLWQFMTDLGLTIPNLPRLRGSTEETLHNARIPQFRNSA